MIYAISDIHGHIDELTKAMEKVDLTGGTWIVFVGDYVECGPCSCQVLKFLHDLQKAYGDKKVIVLKGNHEQMLLDWLREYGRPAESEMDEYLCYDEWLKRDSEHGFETFRSFVSEESFKQFDDFSRRASFDAMNRLAAKLVLSENRSLISWVKKMPLYHDTKWQIFVHAGVDERAGDEWKIATSDDEFMYKYPPTTGKFIKTIVAGHTGTYNDCRSADPDYHGIWFDGESHYYIDGSVYMENGQLNILAFDEKTGTYSFLS